MAAMDRLRLAAGGIRNRGLRMAMNMWTQVAGEGAAARARLQRAGGRVGLAAAAGCCCL